MTLRRFVRKRLRPRLWPVYALGLLLLWLAQPTPTTLLLGLVPAAAGVALRLWATGYLFKNDELTVAGPYAYVRHPLYLGTLLIGAGVALMAWSPWSAVVALLFAAGFFGYYMPYKERIESARLEELYGEAYRRYAVATPALLPRLVPYRPLAAEPVGTPAWSASRFDDNNETGTAVAVGMLTLVIAARWALL